MTEIFKNLKSRISQIESGLGLDGIIDYEKLESYQELTKAYLLLVHAELEKYFEVISVSILYYAFDNYMENETIKIPLISATSTNIFDFKHPDNFDDIKHKDGMSLKDRLSNSLSKFIKLARQNNGIKSKDVFELLWTLGFTKEDIGENLLLMLDSLGSRRGFIAHTGNLINTNLLNINDEKNNAKAIINEIECFDKIVEEKKFLETTIDINKIESIIFTNNS